MPHRIVCLTPVKNEGWILNIFLKAASIWADNIIIADQFSSDDSRLICHKYPKVTLINNTNHQYNESMRQQLLLDNARRLPGKKTLIALDADEFFTPNFSDHEWKDLIVSPPKTVFYFHKYNLTPQMNKYWALDKTFPLAVVDDNKTELLSNQIHNNRLPFNDGWTIKKMNNISVLHLQYVDPKRNLSKMRWYQCWERLNNPKRHPIEIYRQYHHDQIVVNKKILPTPGSWLNEYKKRGVDLTKFKALSKFWWDEEVKHWLNEYGKNKFRWLAIWSDGITNKPDVSLVESMLYFYLNRTQKYYPKYYINRFDNLLKRVIRT